MYCVISIPDCSASKTASTAVLADILLIVYLLPETLDFQLVAIIRGERKCG